MLITGIDADSPEKLVSLSRRWVERFGHSASSELIGVLADALEAAIAEPVHFIVSGEGASAPSRIMSEPTADVDVATRVRVLRDFLSYRLNPPDVAAYVAAYVAVLEEEL